MSKPKSQFQPSNVLLVEVPHQFIALCKASGASPQAALRGMAAMLCGLRYDADDRLVPLDGPTAQASPGRRRCLRPFNFSLRPDADSASSQLHGAHLSKVIRMKEGNHFHMVIHAPAGLSGIERHLEKCLMPLCARTSGFNGQVILENSGAEWMDFHMDPSMTPEMNASGEFFLPAQIAFQILESMSQALASADFPHWIGLDCEQTGRGFAVHYRYPW